MVASNRVVVAACSGHDIDTASVASLATRRHSLTVVSFVFLLLVAFLNLHNPFS